MKTMTIRNVPEDLHAKLRERARRNRRSLNQQVIAELSRLEQGATILDEGERRRRRAEEMSSLVKKFREGVSGFMTADEIDEAIEEGRR
jgi:hypothetical protein